MSARTRTAFFLSVLLHVAAVVAIILIVVVMRSRTRPPQKILELVAGPGMDLTATQAPAKGTPASDTVNLHLPKLPPPPPERREAPPARREPTPPPAVPPPPPPHRTEPKPVERERAPERRPERKSAEPKRAPPPPEQRMSYEEYVRKYGAPKTPSTSERRERRPVRAPRIDVRGIVDGVLRAAPGSTAGSGGKALTAAEHSALEGYIARLVTALRQNLEKPAGVSDLLTADVQFFIAADGTISRVHIVRSSGNAEFDRACLDAFRRLGSIGPKPDNRSATWIITFRMKDE